MEAAERSIDRSSQPLISFAGEQAGPFAQQWISITKQEHIELVAKINYWKALYEGLKRKCAKLEQKGAELSAKNKDLQHRMFGKKSEKGSSLPSEKSNSSSSPKKPRGQAPGSPGHGRTQRPDLPVVMDQIDFPGGDPCCPNCGLPDLPKPGLDEYSELIEVEVKAHTRRYRRPAYVPNPSCQCKDRPGVITAPIPPKLIPRSPFSTSLWVEIILGKFRYGQPTNRYLQDLTDQGVPISPGTVAGGLKYIAPLFEPVLEAFYRKQMTEELFHNDETRWEVFVAIEGKVGHRWYLWVTRSKSVIYYIVDPSRSADVPGAHFAGLSNERVIIVCDRYSAYKKLARLSDAILLAFCWVHVRRDYLDAGRSFAELESWALEWKKNIGSLYHHNKRRLEYWDDQRTLAEQSAEFQYHQEILKDTLQSMYRKATQLATPEVEGDQVNNAENPDDNGAKPLSKSARVKQRKISQSLINHWGGLTLFIDNPQVPLDNNLAETTIRNPVAGRKNFYGSGSIWSAELAAALYSILQTLVMSGINPRHWLTAYLSACAKNKGKASEDIDSFLPWRMDEARRAELRAPLPRKFLTNASPSSGTSANAIPPSAQAPIPCVSPHDTS
ncbi:MAG: IS66 family transposase [Verrucomicrobia bacterium]|nr:MAG: IS66 family transposase [Verrucomicrobiota bacterium]